MSHLDPRSLSNQQYSVHRLRHPSKITGRGLIAASADGSFAANDRHTSRIKMESPSATATTKNAGMANVEVESTDGDSSSQSGEATLVENTKPARKLSVEELIVSPTKSKL